MATLLARVKTTSVRDHTPPLDDSHVPGIASCAVICGLAAIVTAGLRLHARWASKRRLVLDDWLFILALILFISYAVLFGLIAVRNEDRSFTPNSGSDNKRVLGILTIINQNLYALCTTAAKFSIISFFSDAFSSRNFQRCLLIISGFTFLWLLATITVTNIQSWPLRKAWEPSDEGTKYLDFDLFTVLATGLNTVGSLAICAITVPMVLRLRISMRKQRLIYVAYAISTATVAVGFVRFAFALNGTNSIAQGSSNLNFNVASLVELTLGLICASQPIFIYFFPGFNVFSPRDRRIAVNNRTMHQRLNPRMPARISVRITGGQAFGPRRGGIARTDDFSRLTHARVDGNWVRVPDEDETAQFPLAVYKRSYSSTLSESELPETQLR